MKKKAMQLQETWWEDVDFGQPGRWLVRITPEGARSWLPMNQKNRRLRKNYVADLKRQIESDEWCAENPHGIVFTPDPMLTDGQHRLTAISQCGPGTSLLIHVVTGLPHGVRAYIDCGISRTNDDRVQLVEGHSENAFACSISRLWNQYDVHGPVALRRSFNRVSPNELKATFAAHSEAILWGIERGIYRIDKVKRQPVVMAILQFWERSPELAEELLLSLRQADGGEIRQARLLRLYIASLTKAWGAIVQYESWSKTVSACKAYADKRNIAYLRACGGW